MTQEKKNSTHSQYSATSFPESEQIREQAERRAQSIQQPDFSSMTPEEIQQQFHNLQMKQVEAELQNEQLRRRLEACRDPEKIASHRETLVNSLMENIPDIVFIKDTQGVYLACNLEFARHAGRRVEDIIGKTDYDLYSRADADFFRKNDQLMLEQGSFRQNEEWITYPDGRTILLDTMKTPYRDSDGSIIGIMAICRDITRRYYAEKALQKSEERFQKMLSLIPDMISIHDPEMNIAYSNWKGIAGVPEEHRVLGTKCYRTYRHFEEVCPECRAVSVLDTRNALEEEVKLTDGSWVDIRVIPLIDENGAVEAVMEWVRDITDRKESEEILIKNKNLLESLINGIPDILAIQRPDHTIERYNQAGYDFLGMTPEDVVGRKCYELLGRDHECDGCPTRKALQSGKMENTEKYVPELGSYLDCLSSPVLDENGTVIQIIEQLRDITAFKEQEKQLQESERRFRQLFESSPISLWEQDFSAVKNRIDEIKALNVGDLETYFQERPGVVKELAGLVRVLDLNPATLELYRAASKEEFLSGITRVFSRESFEGFIQALLVIAAGGKALLTERDHETLTGSPLKVQLHWRVAEGHEESYSRVIVSIVDLTERKQAEALLGKERMRLENIIEGAYVGTWEWNLQTGETLFNETWAEIVGYTLDELSPVSINTWEALTHPDDLKQAEKRIEQHIAGERPIYDIEIRMRHKAGHWVWIQDRGKVVQWSGDGRPLMMYGTHTDITERKRAEIEREKLQSQFNQAQKMESVGRLAGGVAHDFNNKLAIINGYAEMAADMIDPSDPLHETIREIHTAGMQSAGIVRQLLAFARQQTISPVELDLNDSVSSMLKMLRRLIGENIDLYWHPGANLWPVKIDPSQIDQIMANLAVNARDAISDIGKLTIETKNTIVDDDYSRTNPEAIPGRYVTLVVSDDGCGIEKEAKERLFEPYYTTKEVGKGTGLGLPTIYGIIKQNKGFVNVYSEPGQGTTFRLYFPSSETETISVYNRKTGTGQLPTGTETILLVEDEPAILKMGRKMTERLGYTVLTAENPNEALRVAAEYEGTIHLLVTDVVMPEMNGRDLSSQLVRVHADLKTLYMSGYTADVIARHGVLDEGVQFIQKPFSMEDLAEKVREAILQKQISGSD